MFAKRPVFVDPQLGRLFWSHGHWLTAAQASSEGEVTFRVAGSRVGPNARALDRARSVLSRPTPVVTAAKSYVFSDVEASEFCRGNGELVLDGFAISDEGELSVELTLSGWPDAMVEVKFIGEVPCQALFAD